jgi:hypothetical protein
VAENFDDFREDLHSHDQGLAPFIDMALYQRCFEIHAKIMATSMLVHYETDFDKILSKCVKHLADSFDLDAAPGELLRKLLLLIYRDSYITKT